MHFQTLFPYHDFSSNHPISAFQLVKFHRSPVSILMAVKQTNNNISYAVYITIAFRFSLLYQTTSLSVLALWFQILLRFILFPCTQQIMSYIQNNLLGRTNYSQHL